MALGQKTGGRQKGARNKTAAINRAMVLEGLMPIDFMLALLRNEDAPLDDRKWAANAAAPYVHAKLSSVEMKAEVEATVREIERKIIDA
jgi:hypothetical protein